LLITKLLITYYCLGFPYSILIIPFSIVYGQARYSEFVVINQAENLVMLNPWFSWEWYLWYFCVADFRTTNKKQSDEITFNTMPEKETRD